MGRFLRSRFQALANALPLVLVAFSILIAAGIGSAMRAPDEPQSPPGAERPSLTLSRPAVHATRYRSRVAGNPLARLLHARPATRRVARGRARQRPVRPGGRQSRRTPLLVHVPTTTYSANTTWTLANSPYVVDGTLTVAAGATLTIEPGVIVKFNGSARTMIVNGTLNAVGTQTSPITFTSYQDDTAGGDTNGDGSATTGAPGQWYHIAIRSSGSNQLKWANIRDGGFGTAQNYAPVDVTGSGYALTLDHATITNNQQSAVVVGIRATTTISNSTLSNNKYGLYVDTATASVDHTTIADNSARGVWFNLVTQTPIPAASSITNTDITANTTYGIALYANGDYPLASMPTGTRNNIYANNANGLQLWVTGFPSFKNADVNWRGNYWGDNVYEWYGGGACSGSSPNSSGHLAYRSSSGNVPAGPISSGSYLVGGAWCGYDSFKLTDCDFYTTKLDGTPHVTACQTFGSANGKNPTANLADPVNSATGAFNHAEADLNLPGTGVPFSFTRSYDSLDVTTGELGTGWTDSFAASLLIRANGDVTVHGEDGQQVEYLKQADGSFVGAPGSRSTLAAVTGGYDLTRVDQTKQHFDAQGRLLSDLDRNGQGLTLSYGVDGKLATVTDAASRTISFTHTGGLLTGITMPDSTSVSYGYSNGQLTSYTDQRGKVWTYNYDSHGFLTKETDPLGHKLFENTYGNDGRVTQQLDGANNATTFSWDPATQTQTVTDARGNTRTDIYASNVLVKRTDALNNTTELVHNTSLDPTSSKLPSGDITTMTYDTRGNLLTATAPASLGGGTKTYTYNANNQVTSITDARGIVTSYGYDANGNNTSVVVDGHTVSQMTYNAAGQLINKTDGNNHTTTYTYDSHGNLASETDPLGHTTSYTYDAAGRVLTKVDPRGNEPGANPADFTTSYTYDAIGNKLTETDPLGHTTTYTYDGAGNKLTETDPLGNTTSYAYDNRNELSSMTSPDPDGNGPLQAPQTSYAYDVSGDQLTVTDPLNHTTTKTYDRNKRLATVTTPLGEKTTYSYDANGNLASVVDPRGNATGANPADYTTSSTYDAVGRKLTETDPLGHTTTNVYDAVGNLTSVTDGNGHQTTKTYDGQNQLISVTAPDGGITGYTYDGAGNQLAETDALSHTTTSTYDAANRLLSTTTPFGHTTSYSYDASGNKLTTTDPLNRVTTDTYDQAGRLVTETDPLSHATSYTYDANSNRLSLTDASSHVTSYAYDPLGRLSSVTAPGGGVTSYTYDAAGNVLTRTDANGHTTSYAYDADNRRASLTGPLGRLWTYVYDASGNQTVTVDANGNSTQVAGDGTTTRSYDADNRLTGITYSDSTPSVSFTYDGVGNRASMVDGSGTVSYAYDAADRLTQVSRGSDSFSYVYNTAGELTSRTYPDSTVVINAYDADSHLASVTSGGATTTYAYNAAGQLTTTTLPASDGYVETRSYDAAGRVTEVANTKGVSVLSDFAYTLDPVGNPTRIVRTGSLNETSTFSYDANDRLTSVCYQAACPNGNDPYIRYTYDGPGNRLTETRPSGTTSYSYDAADELSSAGGVGYSYDSNGNELSAGARTFTYDVANRVASTVAGGVTTTYSYDGDGNRIRAATGLSTTDYLWDTNSMVAQLALERDGSGALLRRYLYGNRRVSAHDSSGDFYYHYDELGSVVNVTSQAGDTQWTYSYEPSGVTRTETPVDPQAPANLMRYVGEMADPNGLYYLRARVYDSLTGRFLAPDPLPGQPKDPGEAAYIYADDRPTVLVDPTGLHPVDGEPSGSPVPAVTPPVTPVTPAPELPPPPVDVDSSNPTGDGESDPSGVEKEWDSVNCPSCGERIPEPRSPIARMLLGMTRWGRAKLYFEDSWVNIRQLDGANASGVLKQMRTAAQYKRTGWVEDKTTSGWRWYEKSTPRQLRYSTAHEKTRGEIWLYAQIRGEEHEYGKALLK